MASIFEPTDWNPAHVVGGEVIALLMTVFAHLLVIELGCPPVVESVYVHWLLPLSHSRNMLAVLRSAAAVQLFATQVCMVTMLGQQVGQVLTMVMVPNIVVKDTGVVALFEEVTHWGRTNGFEIV